jgi:hypothetical protein
METISTSSNTTSVTVTTIEYSMIGLINPKTTSLVSKATFLKLVQDDRFILPVQEAASPAFESDGAAVFKPSSTDVLEPLGEEEALRRVKTANDMLKSTKTKYLGIETINKTLIALAREEKVINRNHWTILVHSLTQEEWDQLWTTNPHRINVVLACAKLGLC